MPKLAFLMTDSGVPQTAPVDDPEITIYRADEGGGNSLVLSSMSNASYDQTYVPAGMGGSRNDSTNIFTLETLADGTPAKIWVYDAGSSVFYVVYKDTNTNGWAVSEFDTPPDQWVDGETRTETGREEFYNGINATEGGYAIPPSSDPNVAYVATSAEVLAATAMSHLGGGSWIYDFTTGSAKLDYVYLIDADPNATSQVTIAERHQLGVTSGVDVKAVERIDDTILSRAGLGLETDVAAILVDTGTDIPALINALNDLDAAGIQSALASMGYTTPRAILLDNLDVASSTLATAANLATTDGKVDDILTDTGTTLPAQISALENLSAAAAADAVWDEATAGHVTAGTFGVAATDVLADTAAMQPTVATNLDATISSRAAAADLATTDGKVDTISTNVDAVLVDTGTTLPAQISGLNDPTAAAIAAATWDALRSAHTTAGSTGQALTILLNSIASRGLIDTSGSPWTEVRYVFNEGSGGDSVAFEVYELYDETGTAVTTSAQFVAERRRV